MLNFITGTFCGVVITTALLAWFLHAVEHSKHTEEPEQHERPATIRVRKYPRYRTYTSSADPSNIDPDINVYRTCAYRSVSHSELTAAHANPDRLNDADLNRMGFVLWCMSTRGLFSED